MNNILPDSPGQAIMGIILILMLFTMWWLVKDVDYDEW